MLAASIFAQAPESFTYQAIVRDNLGNPLGDTSVTFQFNILQGSATETTIYSENQVTTTNSFGLVNLQIGQGTINSGDLHLIFDASDRGSFNQTSGAYTALSDKSLKKNFEDMTDVLPKIDNITPKRYNFKTQNDGDQKYMGFIAQDIKRLISRISFF